MVRKKKVVKKKIVQKVIKKDNVIEEIKENIKEGSEEVEEGIEEVEKWILERRKFFKKLVWVVSFIVVLLILSNLYLRVEGFG